MTMFAWTCLLTGILSLLLGMFVILKNKKNPLSKKWFQVSISIAIWSLGFLCVIIADSINIAFYSQYFLDAGGIFVPITFYQFVILLIDKKDRYKKSYFISYLIGIILLLLSFTSLFKVGMIEFAGFKYWIEPGILYFLFPLSFVYYLLYSLYLLMSEYNKSKGIRKNQIKYVLIGALIGFSGGMTDFFPQLIQIYPFGNYFIAFYIIAIAYAITRYRLMDIKLIIKRSTVFALLVIFITAIYAFATFIIGKIFENLIGNTSIIFNGLIAGILIAIGFEPLKIWLQSITDRFLFSKEYEPRTLMAESSDITSSTLNLHEILQGLSDKLSIAFHPSKLAFILLTKSNKLAIAQQFGFKRQQAVTFLKGKEKVLSKYFKGSKQIYIIPELVLRFEKGEYKPKNVKLLTDLEKMDIDLVVPLFTKDKLIGLLVMGGKKNNNPYSSEDLQVISIISRQVAVALENASLYDEVLDLNVNLQKKVDEQTADIRDKNVKLQKLLQMKDDFLHIASHQLRTPLTAIVGMLSMQDQGDFERLPKEKADELKHNMYLSGKRLNNIVNDLLDASEIETGAEMHFEQIDLVNLINEAITTLKPEYDKQGLYLKFDAKGSIPKITGSPQYLREIFMNMIHNAQRYTPQGGVKIILERKGNNVKFTITDTGIGITKEEIKSLFKKFSRGKRATALKADGSGLGLFIAKNIIDQHKGKIEVKSEGINKGATFIITLPIYQKDSGARLI